MALAKQDFLEEVLSIEAEAKEILVRAHASAEETTRHAEKECKDIVDSAREEVRAKVSVLEKEYAARLEKEQASIEQEGTKAIAKLRERYEERREEMLNWLRARLEEA